MQGLSYSSKRFYINYEECKCYRTPHFINSIPSFILTMRNVNLNIRRLFLISKNRFILTMRNVNKVRQLGQVETGCGFILTMRNVNLGVNNIIALIAESFILTMRNVNVGEMFRGNLDNVVLY